MRRTLYRINYKVVEPKKQWHGTRVVAEPINEYIRSMRKQHPDAMSIYMELVEEFEEDDEDTADTESVIILG